MIDVSDGLSSDLNRICNQSRVSALLDAKSIPVSDEARRSPDPLASALNDGEDFELLFTLAEENCSKLLKQWNDPLLITRIGTITDLPATADTGRMQIKMPDGQITELKPSGYDHLK
jgi:thiamine-monophosphate kinase